MGLGKMFGKKSGEQESTHAAAAAAPTGECMHVALTPRWDSIEDMGKQDRARFVCDACHESFSPAEAQEKARNAADRMRSEVA